MENNLVDCCIIGGSAAGLSAALILGRCNRKVLVFDDGNYRNYAVNKMNGYLGNDGVDPKEFRAKARKDLEKYDVKIINSHVDNIRKEENYFIAEYEFYTVKTKTVILATGLIDQLPDIPGLKENYGKRVQHCNICEAFEYRNKNIGVHGEKGLDFALVLKDYSDNITWFADKEPSEEEKQISRDNNISVVWEKIVKFISYTDTIGVCTEKKTYYPNVIFLSLSKGQKQRSKLAEKLGLKVTKENGIECNEEGETSIPGIYAAGDSTRDHLLSIIAASEGCIAAINCSSYIRKVWRK